MVEESLKEEMIEDESIEEIEQEAKQATKIKMYITIAVMVILLAGAFLFDDQTDGYPMKIKTPVGTEWTCTVTKPDVLEITSQEYDGKSFRLLLDGKCEGETDIEMVRTPAGEDEVLETRVYHMSVDENGKIHQDSVTRTTL